MAADILKHRVTTIVLAIGVLLALGAMVPKLRYLHLPNNHQGYAPKQPVAFSHRKHAGKLQVPCLYCHASAEKGRHAGIPTATTCFGCHRFVPSNFAKMRVEYKLAKKQKRKPKLAVNRDIQKVYDALALGPDLKRNPNKATRAIRWVRVHALPDFVNFNHSRHVNAGVACAVCHGPVDTMERVSQFSDLSMGWCVTCHRTANKNGINGVKVNASLDCGNCHY
jgi:hypothetical protein